MLQLKNKENRIIAGLRQRRAEILQELSNVEAELTDDQQQAEEVDGEEDEGEDLDVDAEDEAEAQSDAQGRYYRRRRRRRRGYDRRRRGYRARQCHGIAFACMSHMGCKACDCCASGSSCNTCPRGYKPE